MDVQQRETDDGRQSIDGMVEHAVGVLTMREDADGWVVQRHKLGDSDMLERVHAAHEMP